MFRGIVNFAVIVFCVASACAEEVPQVARRIEPFRLRDTSGAEFDLAKDPPRYRVITFLGIECPLAKLYGPRLVELAARFAPQNVGFVAINSNQQDTLAEMAHYARQAKMEFPFLKDPTNSVADAFTAKRTPEVFVLDQQYRVRYHGRIDDQFGVGTSRKEPTRQDLAIALDELLAGKPVTTAETTATGCHIGRVNRISPRGKVTYNKHIAAIMEQNCVSCHRSGEIGPFALTSYEDVAQWSATIREVVNDQRMPPWHAETDAGKFVNDRRLSASDKQLLFDWIDNGMPVGNSSDLPKPKEFVEGWQIPRPDVIYQMAEPFNVIAKGTVEYQYFPLNATFEEDKWVVASEARPGNRAVVHHLILFYAPADYDDRRIQEAALKNSIATFAPGIPAWRAPPGMARRIPAGSKLYFQAHYTPNGVEATDLSRAGLVFADPKQIQKELQTDAVVNFRLRIPPQTDNAKFNAEFGFGRDMRLISLLPHMHLRGKAFRIEAVQSNGDRQLLLDVPHYDFNWQNTYVFAEPVLMREGTVLSCAATFDNSDKNPANPDPSQTVGWGDQTWQEMMVAQFEAVLENQDLRNGGPQVLNESGGEFEVEFAFRPDRKPDAVYLAGSFNEWKPDGLKMTGPDSEGRYVSRLKLKSGLHEYKFVIDGKTWCGDPNNRRTTGAFSNSVLTLGKSVDGAGNR